MAVSDLEIEPDLDKAPPHVEGELLKQNTKAVISKWRKYYFVVSRDKLRYFPKKDDYQSNKNPTNVVRLSRVTDISESVFNKVPRKSHLNSGFSITEMTSQGGQVYNLLAEAGFVLPGVQIYEVKIQSSPEMMRYWVHALRYVKAYWSKKQVRETVINEEIERKLLEQVLREEEEEDDGENDFLGQYSIVDGQDENRIMSFVVNFADSSRVTYKFSAQDKVSELLERSKDKLSSSAAQIWIVDHRGKEYSLDPDDALGLYQPNIQQFFAVDPTHRVIVVFIDDSDDFVPIVVPFKITAQEVIQDSAIAPKLDIAGIGNRGLFLKKQMAALFQATECPCDALYTEKDGAIHRIQDAGYLLIKNKALDRGRPSKWRHSKSLAPKTLDSEKISFLKSELEEEEAEQRALMRVQQKRKALAQRDYCPIPQPLTIPEGKEQLGPRNSYTPPTIRHEFAPDRSQRSNSEVVRGRSRAFVQANLEFPPEKSPLSSPKRIYPKDKHDNDIIRSPTETLTTTTNSSGVIEPLIPPPPSVIVDSGESSPLVRRKALRSRQGHSVIKGQRKRNESILADLIADSSRSSTFVTTSAIGTSDGTGSEYPSIGEEDERIEQLFSTSYQEKEDEERIRAELDRQTSLTDLKLTVKQEDMTEADEDPVQDDNDDVELPSNPLFIEFDSLRNDTSVGRSFAPITIHRPSILKVILMQFQATDSPTHNRDMDMISFSGVVLRWRDKRWELHEGYQYHDPEHVRQDEEEGSIMETHPLPGGIVTVYNHTQGRWYVLPPLHLPSPTQAGTPLSDDHVIGGGEYDAESEAVRVFAHHQYLQKRGIVTEIGSSFNEILEQFKDCKSTEEKKKIASDMANNNIGHMVRGRFCTSIVTLLFDGLKLQKLGFVQQDVWKVIGAFCQEGYNLYYASATNIYATIEGRVLKPIKGEGRLTNNHMRFRAFVCLCISRGVFLQWLTDLPLLKDTIRKHYSPDSLLYLASIAGDPTYDKLYDEIILSLEPLPFIPFQLSLSFEVQTPSELSVIGSHSRSVSPAPSPIHNPPIKTSKTVMESTGQRTSDHTSITSILNDSFSEVTNNVAKPKKPQTSSLLDTFTVEKIINVQSGPSWFKKFTSSLNVGGAITGTPGSVTPIPVVSTLLPSEEGKKNEYYVEALFDNDDVGLKELQFKKGDTLKVKENVDENWLLCVRGNDSGIVPVNYVKSIH